jgi:hypothetical protein
MPSPKPEDRRQSPRYPHERLAKIQLGVSGPSEYCLVTDVSDGGVRLNAFGRKIPDEFILSLSGDGPAEDGRYFVIWRLGSDVGAKRLSPASDAEWTY